MRLRSEHRGWRAPGRTRYSAQAVQGVQNGVVAGEQEDGRQTAGASVTMTLFGFGRP
jgi:hypothetical protein